MSVCQSTKIQPNQCNGAQFHVMSNLKRYTLLERLLVEMCHSLGLPPFWWRISLDIHVLWGFYLMQTGRASPTPYWPFAVYFLHLHGIMERLWLIFLAVCLCECLSVSQQNSSRTEAPIWTWFLLHGCVVHWLGPYWNWWHLVEGQSHS